MKSSLQVHTFGCKVNTYDTGLLQKRLVDAGFTVSGQDPDIHLLNSCAVTQEATREAARRARKIKKDNPKATVVLTGCAAQVDGKVLDEVPEFDLIVANSHKGEIENLLEGYLAGQLKNRVFRSNIFRNESLGVGGGEELNHTRSFLKIQDGCNSFCTFCIIPYARGKSRSLPVPILLEKIRNMVSNQLQEVVLTGVHIGDYEDNETPGGPFRLSHLVEEVLEKTSVGRVRLTSLEPIEIDDRLYSLFDNPRLCDHFHMSIQSANSHVLKLMKRKYSHQEVEESLIKISKRRPGAFVGMDVIAGFPGETAELFEDTFQRLKNLPWTRLHVFPYSEREGTRAPLLEGAVPLAERKERAARLRALSEERFDQWAVDQVGKEKWVLPLQGQSTRGRRGLSRDYWDIYFDSSTPTDKKPEGHEILLRVSGYERAQGGRMNGHLVGKVIS